jgi:hypothetical protein
MKEALVQSRLPKQDSDLRLHCLVAWERVHTISDYYDGPRLGVADIEGVPHIFQSSFDTVLNDFPDFYLVSPIDSDLFTLVLEDWAIWLRWFVARGRGETSDDTHPALPKDRARHEAIEQLIGERLAVDPKNNRRLIANFRNPARSWKNWDGWEVEWTACDSDSS